MNLKNKLKKNFIRFNHPDLYEERLRQIQIHEEDIENIMEKYKLAYETTIDRMKHNSYDVKVNHLLGGTK